LGVKKLSVIIFGVILFGIVNTTVRPFRLSGPRRGERLWVEDLYKEATSVKVGMSRADLLKLFEVDDGLQRIPADRYVLRSYPLIKVDVEFDVKYGRGYKERPDAEIKIKGISKPYLER
jgi:hypothetical protein